MERIWTAAAALALSLGVVACEMPEEEDLNGRPTAQTEAERQSQIEEAVTDDEEAVEAQPREVTAELDVADKAPYGEYLVDGQGVSLYLFEADSPGESTCHGECAEAWPPFLTDAEVVPGEGVDSELVGTLERDDGTVQVTYGQWPLYYFVRDGQPGATEGQDVEGFGAEWYLVTPQGDKVDVEAAGAEGS